MKVGSGSHARLLSPGMPLMHGVAVGTPPALGGEGKAACGGVSSGNDDAVEIFPQTTSGIGRE